MNNLVRSQNMPMTQDGWVWNGTNWVCDPDCPPSPCPPTFPFPPFGPPVFSGPTNQPPWYPGANGGVSFGQAGNFPPNPVRGNFFYDGKSLWLFDGAEWVTVGTTGAPGAPGSAAGAGTVVISSTAPGNPATGSQWWDGSVLRMWNGSAWVAIGPGMAVGPVPTTTQVFSVIQPGFFTAPTAWGIVQFTATPQVDTLLGFDPSSKKYTAKKAGMYLFEGTCWESTTGGFALAKNDPGTFTDAQTDILVAIATSGAGGHLDWTGLAVMNGTTDYVRLFGYSAGAQFWGSSGAPILSATLLP